MGCWMARSSPVLASFRGYGIFGRSGGGATSPIHPCAVSQAYDFDWSQNSPRLISSMAIREASFPLRFPSRRDDCGCSFLHPIRDDLRKIDRPR